MDPNIDKFVPFYQSKEGEYWNTNLQRANKDFKHEESLRVFYFEIRKYYTKSMKGYRICVELRDGCQ